MSVTCLEGPTADGRGGAPGGAKKIVLLVEDDPLTRGQLCTLLGDEYEVLAACDGEEALRLYERREGRVDVVVTDYRMPRLDGVRLAELLAARDPRLSIIMVSASAGREEVERLFKLPKFALLWKPFEVKVLFELIEGFAGETPTAPG